MRDGNITSTTTKIFKKYMALIRFIYFFPENFSLYFKVGVGYKTSKFNLELDSKFGKEMLETCFPTPSS